MYIYCFLILLSLLCILSKIKCADWISTYHDTQRTSFYNDTSIIPKISDQKKSKFQRVKSVLCEWNNTESLNVILVDEQSHVVSSCRSNYIAGLEKSGKRKWKVKEKAKQKYKALGLSNTHKEYNTGAYMLSDDGRIGYLTAINVTTGFNLFKTKQQICNETCSMFDILPNSIYHENYAYILGLENRELKIWSVYSNVDQRPIEQVNSSLVWNYGESLIEQKELSKINTPSLTLGGATNQTLACIPFANGTRLLLGLQLHDHVQGKLMWSRKDLNCDRMSIDLEEMLAITYTQQNQLVALDLNSNGDIVWTYTELKQRSDFSLSPSNHLVYLTEDSVLGAVDINGKKLWETKCKNSTVGKIKTLANPIIIGNTSVLVYFECRAQIYDLHDGTFVSEQLMDEYMCQECMEYSSGRVALGNNGFYLICSGSLIVLNIPSSHFINDISIASATAAFIIIAIINLFVAHHYSSKSEYTVLGENDTFDENNTFDGNNKSTLDDSEVSRLLD